MQGNFEAWNKVLPHGFIPGDNLGNSAVGAHLLLAVIVIVSGPLQLVPQIRARAPAFHHWNGRIYLLTVFATSLVGLYMVWTRETLGGVMGEISISLNAVLIMAFAVLTVRYAIARNIRAHRRWALRLFLVVSGVWFFRVGLMAWIILNSGPVGFDPKTFTGPFLTFLGFAQYLLPLAVVEVYFRTQDRAGAPGRFVMAASLLVLTLLMSVGIFAAAMGMWLPRLAPTTESTVQVADAAYDSNSMRNTGQASGALMDCGTAEAICSASGQVCLIRRGNTSFHDKVLNCENGGGVAAIIYNNETGAFEAMLGGSNGTTIPAVTVSDTDGVEMINNRLGQTVNIDIFTSD